MDHEGGPHRRAVCRPHGRSRVQETGGGRRTLVPYLVHSPQEREEMLAAIGVESMDALLAAIPPSLRIHDLKLPRGLSEFETIAAVRDLAAANRVFADRLTF